MWNSEMAEQSAYVSIVKDPSKRLCECVGGIDFAADELHLDV